MKQSFIALLDSGIGGISVLNELVKNFPNECFLYLGDNYNAPYGNKSIKQLLSITKTNLDMLKSYPLKAVVVACNTLSVNIIKYIREYSGVPTFGVFPPVEYCLMKWDRTLLLSTNRTADVYRNKYKKLDVVGLSGLVAQIEKNMFNLPKIDVSTSLLECSDGKYCDKKGYYQSVILGCTHYNFVKNQISDHFQPQNVIDGTTFTIINLKKFLQSSKSLVKTKQNEVLFIGNCALLNKCFFANGGQNVLI